MRFFVIVAESLSFTRAAESLNTSKASVSNAISSLETELGTRLFHRSTRSIQLTQDGLIYLDRCKDLLDEYDELGVMFIHDKEQVFGKLKVDLPGRIAKKIAIPNLISLFQKFPNLEVELGSTDKKSDLIQERIDCVVRVGDLEDSSLITRKIGELKMINCASPQYLKNFGPVKELHDLTHHLLIHYLPKSRLKSRPEFDYQVNGEVQHIKMRSRLTVNTVETYIESALNHHGIIQVPEYDVIEHIQDGKLKTILGKYNQKSMPISFLYPHKKHLSQKVIVFMEWFEKVMKKYIVK